MKKLLAIGAVAGAVFLVIRRSRSAKAEADLWREATAPAANNGAKK
ncbi:DLW-39 family protein [Kibdelosporangium lantanae]|uniref:DLW-39 family protein n=1 Tax=Kibdelosporangium lantanae TaxID=1497396 RepID=A0ABW3M8G7_9PSEU